jgi:tRNA dimethylallyltransferase
MSPKTIIILTGPTASGKTDLAASLASHFQTDIISADSRQCFRELNIGVAKPDTGLLERIPHHFINSHSVEDTVNAAVFESMATRWCESILDQHEVVIVCGGTGLYIKAFLEGLDEIPAVEEAVRRDILAHYKEEGLGWLQEKLRQEDPQFYACGEIENPQRLMRALEVVQSTGRSIISYRHQQKKQLPYRILEFAMLVPRPLLYRRINERVEGMMDAGLLAEVQSLLRFRHLNALQTVGYTELFEYLDGMRSLNDSIARIQQNTRHYAKRQMTWLNKIENLQWIGEDHFETILRAYHSLKTYNRL